jgi:hypothetical protein
MYSSCHAVGTKANRGSKNPRPSAVQKLSHEDAQEAQRKNHFASNHFAKKIRVFRGTAQVQKAST